MRQLKHVVSTVGLVLGLATGAVPGLLDVFQIHLVSPSVMAGGLVVHSSSVLQVKGEVITPWAVDRIEINGQLAALTSRDLVVEAGKRHRIPFHQQLVLEPGEHTIELSAHAVNGKETRLSFSVRVDSTALQGTAYALVVGINQYQDRRLTNLRFAEADAYAVSAALSHPEYGIVAPENMRVLTGREATYQNITTTIEEHLVRQARNAEDIVFFYFAGHGVEGPHISRGAAYFLVPADAQVDNLLSTGLEKGRLQFLWGAIPAIRKIFITDACHSGGMQHMRVLTADGLEAVESFITLAAARADQQAWELPALGQGIFTHALVQGLQGGADRQGGNRDGFVAAGEMGRFLLAKVKEEAGRLGVEQVPVVEMVPQADQVLLSTSAGKPLPTWKPSVLTELTAKEGPLQVEIRFRQRARAPRILVVMQAADQDPALGRLAETAVIGRFREVSDAFEFVDPGLLTERLSQGQQGLAFSERSGDLAAVARALTADIILTGRVITTVADSAAQALLGQTMRSAQAHLDVRAVWAHSGEVAYALTVQQPGLHINSVMARHTAVLASGRDLADELMGTLLEQWSEGQLAKPDGLVQISNLVEYEQLQQIERWLASLLPHINDLAWRSFEVGTAVFEFSTRSRPDQLAAVIERQPLAEYVVDEVRVTSERLSFKLH